jgi:peptidyl-prolyl cis-trans isomerase SurA
LNDKEIYDKLEHEAYDRMQTEVKVSHLLIKVAVDASPADTLAAYKKIMAIRKDILKSKDFAGAAKQFSEDPSAKNNSGNLGYLTVFQTVYPFETAMYSEKVGDVSMPVRTKFGYHLVKVEDRRPERGFVNVEHLFIAVNDKSLFNADSSALFKIKSIMQDVKDGKLNFEQAVNQYTEDRKTKMKNGELGWFTTGKMTEAFENAAFALKNKGDISEPIRSATGWHVIKLIDKKPVQPFNDVKSELKTKIDRDSRSDLSRASLVAKIQKKYGTTEYADAKKEITKMVDSTLQQGRWFPSDPELRKPLLKVADMTFDQNDFVTYLIKNQKGKRPVTTPMGIYNAVYEEWVEARCMDYYEKQLESEYPEFKMLMKEYRDGILLFDLTDRQVWSRAVKDTNGLKNFYETVKNKHMWGNRADVDIYNCTDAKIANEARKLVEKKKSPEEIQKTLNKEGSSSKVSVISGKYEKGQYDLVDKTDWSAGLKPNIMNPDSSVTFVFVKQMVGPEPKSLNESKGYVVSDYQEYLEKQWIEELRAAYPIKVDEAVFHSLIKK